MKLDHKEIECLTQTLDSFDRDVNPEEAVKSLNDVISKLTEDDSFEIFLETKHGYLALTPINIINTFLKTWLPGYKICIIHQEDGGMDLEIVKLKK